MRPPEGALAACSPARRRFAFERSSLAAAALGAATVAGFSPLYLYPVPVVTVALLMWLWRGAPSPNRAAALGFWFGLGFFLAGVSWVYVSLHTFGGMPAPLAALATLLFCAYLALFPAATGYACAKLSAPVGVTAVIFVPAFWTVGEWIRGWLFTGFPWLGVGYSQVPHSPLSGYAPVLGIYGVTLVTVATAGLVVTLAERVCRHFDEDAGASRQSARVLRSVIHPAFFVLLAIWIAGYGLGLVKWTVRTGEPTTVALLQGNIPQDIKWTAEGLHKTLIQYRALALDSDAKLIVFPETALPLFLDQVPAGYLESLAAHARANGGDMLLGVPERLPEGDYFNSVVSLGASPQQTYRKVHLVPFGEFIPLRPLLAGVVGALAIPLQDFSRGPTRPTPLAVAGQRVAVNICYEDAFGEEIIRQLPEATLLVNVSNVAWFGHSIAPMQHLQISQTRALETGRYMLRATNTGMTAIIDPQGRVEHVAPQFESAALTGTVHGHTGTTPYVRWGNYAVLALSLLFALLAVVIARGRRDSARAVLPLSKS